MNLIQTLEQEELARLNKEIPAFAPGDTVIVSVNVIEGTRKRVQAYEGVVIARRNRGLNSSFIVRKISNGEGVERTFPLYSPLIAKIEVKRRGDVRRAKLYYLREGQHKQPDYLVKNRYGQVPALRDGQTYFVQSAAILQHLADELHKFDGKTDIERNRIREWMFWLWDKLSRP